MTTIIRLLSSIEKAQALLQVCQAVRLSQDDTRIYEVTPGVFHELPGSPFAYWANDNIRRLFHEHPRAESDGRRFTKGLCTTDDDRFLRLRWEVDPAKIGVSQADFQGLCKWAAFAKGGEGKSFYVDNRLLINWQAEGAELKAYLDGKIGREGQWSRWINSVEYYFRPGLTWPLRAARFSPQVLPTGSIFSVRGYAAFAPKDELVSLLGLTASFPFDALFKTLLGRFGFPEFVVGVLQQLPMPSLNGDTAEALGRAAREAWSLRRRLDEIEELSNAFLVPAFVRERLGKFDSGWIEGELLKGQATIDELGFQVYGLRSSDRANLERASEDEDIVLKDESDDEEPTPEVPAETKLALLSWSVGIAFGRFDWRLATGERAAPPEPEPFDPLPAKSPGMLPDGLDPFHRHPGLLVDDPSHPHDLAHLVEEVLARVEAPAPDDVRRWLQRDFFAFHLQRYSKSRRKAPIYWPLATASGSYTLWIYYPSLTSQTLYTAINDFIEPKLKQLGDDVTALRNKGAARSRDDEKQFETLQTSELELIELRDTLLTLAPTYKPNQDDGVQITAAPLWPLFRHKPWQKLLKDSWAKLEKGDNDWAHMAMNYWPDRVRDKCKTDKSLAIAHNLEDLYVEPEAKPTKTRGRKKAGGEE